MCQWLSDTVTGLFLAPFFIGALLFVKMLIKNMLGIKPRITPEMRREMAEHRRIVADMDARRKADQEDEGRALARSIRLQAERDEERRLKGLQRA